MMIFSSSPCTSKEQSQRIMDLGVNVETADMYHYVTSNGCGIAEMDDDFLPHMDTPAWSLDRLLQMCPPIVNNPPRFIAISPFKTSLVLMTDKVSDNFTVPGGNTYDNMIDCIEWLINNKQFNTNYLKK